MIFQLTSEPEDPAVYLVTDERIRSVSWVGDDHVLFAELTIWHEGSAVIAGERRPELILVSEGRMGVGFAGLEWQCCGASVKFQATHSGIVTINQFFRFGVGRPR